MIETILISIDQTDKLIIELSKQFKSEATSTAEDEFIKGQIMGLSHGLCAMHAVLRQLLNQEK